METSCKWAIWGHLLIADGTETSGAACDSHTRERFVLMTLSAFCNSQEVLRCGRSFEVEKLLSDERYQTFKVSRQKQKAPLSFCFSHFCRFDIGPNMICICYLLRTWYFDCPLPLQPEPPRPIPLEKSMSFQKACLLLTSLPRFLPAVHKCVWGWTQDGWQVVPRRAALIQRGSGRPQHSSQPDAANWYINISALSLWHSTNYRLKITTCMCFGDAGEPARHLWFCWGFFGPIGGSLWEALAVMCFL